MIWAPPSPLREPYSSALYADIAARYGIDAPDPDLPGPQWHRWHGPGGVYVRLFGSSPAVVEGPFHGSAGQDAWWQAAEAAKQAAEDLAAGVYWTARLAARGL
jgi:hypothetical protein